MYHALGYNTIVFIKAMLTCDKADLERSMQVSKEACAVIERFRQKFSLSDTFLSLGGKYSRNMTDEELHAELCYAESLLVRAALAFFQDDNFASFVRGALRIRSCYQIYRCNSLYRLCGSKLKSKAWLEFSNSRFGAGEPDLALCHRLIPSLMCKYPKGAVVLFLRARLMLVSGDIDSAIYCFNLSIESQQDYKQFHHVAYWELLFSHCYLGQWAKAANYAKRLVNESRWSRCVYTYLLCILFAADDTCETSKRNETVAALAKKVDGLRQRIAGKSIPVEKYCAKKANRFVAKQSLMFAHYEFMYFWSGFDIVGSHPTIMQGILEDLENIWLTRKSGADADDRALYFFLKAVCLRNLRRPVAAESAIREVMKL
ncbi:hypothetical protein ANCCAN_22035 [Ancylostoma caninum]|uniref:Tetratricopeptide repeat protein n=1 Tax=Ancylostoma caninum TaxID=29170 RepID=A0A368FKV1_ANCCA|nr:hypothetical protein ANCCAN_22035 [Ancylostoma caninum]